MRQTTTLIATVIAIAAPLAHAAEIEVTVTGTVEFNLINPPPLGNVNVGDDATMTFRVDSSSFVDSPNFPTRGYDIDPTSFSLLMGITKMELQNPFPVGQTPYFAIRDNDPAVDGFMVTTNVDFPLGVPIDQTGGFGQFIDNFYATYTGGTLPSLDILDAVGTYDFTNLTVFNWTIDDGPVNALGIVFSEITIAPVDECVGDVADPPDGAVTVVDLLALLAAWGPCPSPCPPHCAEDFNGDCRVTVVDLLELLAAWGPC